MPHSSSHFTVQLKFGDANISEKKNGDQKDLAAIEIQ